MCYCKNQIVRKNIKVKNIKVKVKKIIKNDNPDKFEIHLCKGCIEDLKEYNPWTVSPADVCIVEVPIEDCDNNFISTQPWVRRNEKYNLKHNK